LTNATLLLLPPPLAGGRLTTKQKLEPSALRAALDAEVSHYQAHALAESSTKNASTALRAYAVFCWLTDDYPDPKEGISDAQLARYVAFLARTHAHSTIEQYITMGPRLYQRQTLGLDWKVPSERFPVHTTLTGVKRIKGSGPTRRKLPFTLEMLAAMAPHMAIGSNQQDTCLWAAWLTMFFGMLRKGNTTTVDSAKATPPCVIQRSDVLIEAAPSGPSVRITVRHTKTIQFGQRALTFYLPRRDNAPPHMCPTKVLIAHLMDTREVTTGPLFAWRQPEGTGHRVGPVPYQVMLARLKTAMVAAGLPAEHFASHSFRRRGGATYAFLLVGMPDHMIMILGDWKSPVWRDYAEVQLELRRRGAELFSQR
jgi:hypothetical protein